MRLRTILACAFDLDISPLKELALTTTRDPDTAWTYATDKAEQPTEMMLMSYIRCVREPHIMLNQACEISLGEIVLLC